MFLTQRDFLGESGQGEEVLGLHPNLTAVPWMRILPGVPRERLPGQGFGVRLVPDPRGRADRRPGGLDIHSAANQLGTVPSLGSSQAYSKLFKTDIKILERQQ